MNASHLFMLISQFVFGILGILSAVDLLRRPGRTRLDIALMLNSLTIPMVIGIVTEITGTSGRLLVIVNSILLLTHPYLLLRLVQNFRPVPRWTITASALGLLISGLLLAFVTPPMPSPAIFLIIAYAIFFEAFAAVTLLRGTAATSGVAHQRTSLVAVGTGLLGLMALAIGVAFALPSLEAITNPLISLIAAASATSYYLAFAMPRSLRRHWQLQELYAFLAETIHPEVDIKPEYIHEALCRFAGRAVGSTVMVMTKWDTETKRLSVVAGSTDSSITDLVLSNGPIMQAVQQGQPQLIQNGPDRDPAYRALFSAFQMDTLFILPLTSKMEHQALLVFLPRNSLFQDDDLAMLSLFAHHTGLLLDSNNRNKQAIEEELRQKTVYVRLLHDAALAANEATVANTAFKITLDRICAVSGASVGHILMRSPSNPDDFISSGVWHLDDPARFEPIRRATEAIRFSTGTGSIGRVIESGGTEGVNALVDIDDHLARAGAFRACGITAIFASAIVIRREVEAVVELFFTQPTQLSDEFLEVIRNICTQLGRVIERDQAEEALRQRETTFRTTFEQSAVGIAHTDVDGRWLQINEKLSQILGYPREELLQETWQSITYPEDLPLDLEQTRRLMAGEIDTYSMEKRFIRKDGSLIWANLTTSLARKPSGEASHIIVVIEDISERIQTQEALRDSEARYAGIFEMAADAIISLDESLNIIQFNRGAESIFGYEPEEILGKPLDTVLPPSFVEIPRRLVQAVTDVPETGERAEVYGYDKSGREFLAEATLSRLRLSDQTIITIILRDITERKQFERALEEERNLLRTVLENIPVSVYVKDVAGRFLVANQSITELVGKTHPQELLGRTDFELYPPSLAQQFYRDEQHIFHTGEAVFEKEEALTTPHGMRLVMTTKLPLRNAGGQITGIVGLNYDITELKQAEERFRALMELAPDAMVIVNQDGKIVLVNAQTERLFGYSRDELLGQAVEILVPNPYRSRHPGHRRGYVADPHVRGMGNGLELYALRKDGSQFPVEISLSPIETPQGTLIASAVRDVTERQRFLEQIQQMNQELELRVEERTARLQAANQELEAFTYSVSHDLRAPLRAIHAYSLYLQENFPSQLPDQARHYVDRIHSNSQTMGELIDTLLALSHLDRQALARRWVSPNEIVQQALETVLGENANGTLEIDIADLPVCYADPTLLRQVFVNLLANAVKFSRIREQPTIEVGYYQAEDSKIVYYVKDNGAGFDMEFADKLYGVFQRLHDEDEFEGNGAGLSIVQRIVQRHEGTIWAEGEVGRGAAFYFVLGEGEEESDDWS